MFAKGTIKIAFHLTIQKRLPVVFLVVVVIIIVVYFIKVLGPLLPLPLLQQVLGQKLRLYAGHRI